MTLVLGIETSCDETGIGIVRGSTLLANVISSSMEEHARYGGVVPEVAARAHLEALQPSIDAALAEAGVALSDIDAVAVTSGPGLAGALMVGVGAAKALALALARPLYAVNHLVGHVGADVLRDDGTLYLHLDWREAHYAKVALDALFGRECFLNELIWAYDYGAKSRRRWPTKHDTILVYVKNPDTYYFDSDAVDREPYMAPGLVTPEKAARGKLPTDVWWHTIVTTNGREKTGYPTQKPLGVLRRIVAASSREGDWVLDPFAGSGTTAAAARELGRRSVSIDANPEAVQVMSDRLGMPVTTLSDAQSIPSPATKAAPTEAAPPELSQRRTSGPRPPR